MKLVIFGLTLSSSWGNGHATLWRGLIRALTRRNHDVVFFERDVPYYAEHRDLAELPGASLVLYREWPQIAARARSEAQQADVAVVTSYCPDAKSAAALVRTDAPAALCVFYDLDTPVTLARLEAGETVDYLPAEGLRDFDLVLSYAGGTALEALRERLGARRVAALYGHVDPDAHRPAPREERFSADLSYLGTYAPDRQPALETLFVEPARRRPAQRFVLGGSGYPPDFPWAGNIWFVRHVAPPEHPPFYSSSRLTLNVTRRDMAAMGFCPSGRLFEAAACATPVLSDAWDGIDRFFTPGEEILLAGSAEEATAALDLPPDELARIGRAARERALAEHTSDCRAARMLSLLDQAASRGT
ncbi:MAG TPA: glycosyltransferase [Steroidobacteraceae bacterium]|nr:glycosyltransferase [Steroidobacteraceae bacterium]